MVLASIYYMERQTDLDFNYYRTIHILSWIEFIRRYQDSKAGHVLYKIVTCALPFREISKKMCDDILRDAETEHFPLC